jgi:hypothetical protein
VRRRQHQLAGRIDVEQDLVRPAAVDELEAAVAQ